MNALQQGGSPNRIRVLLVDDQPDVRLAFRYMLEADGYEVIEAANGTEALAQLAQHPVDVILTDLYMPWMDGLSLVRAVRSSGRPAPRVIAMTGSPNLGKDASLQAARILGADAVLRKPISRAELQSTIQELLSEPAQASNPAPAPVQPEVRAAPRPNAGAATPTTESGN